MNYIWSDKVAKLMQDNQPLNIFDDPLHKNLLGNVLSLFFSEKAIIEYPMIRCIDWQIWSNLCTDPNGKKFDYLYWEKFAKISKESGLYIQTAELKGRGGGNLPLWACFDFYADEEPFPYGRIRKIGIVFHPFIERAMAYQSELEAK